MPDMAKRKWPLWVWGLLVGGIPSGVVLLWFSVTAGSSLSEIMVGLILVATFAALGAWLGVRWGEDLNAWQGRLNSVREGELPELPGARIREWEAFRDSWDQVRQKTKRIFQTQKEFTANAAHELRTPLAALRLTGEGLFQGNPDTNEVKETVGAMLEEADRVQRLVDQLLMLARAESGRIPIEADYLNLREVVDEVVEVREVLAEDRGQEIQVEADGNWSVWADRNLLRLAFDNLLANALRHSPAKSRVFIRIRRRSEGGIALEVQDAGSGLTPGQEDAVFERFYRGPGAVVGEGFGLGLPISRWAVEAFGGSLAAHNAKEGPGAQFTLLCPETEWDHFARTKGTGTRDGWQEVEEEWVVEAAPGQVLARMESAPQGLSETEVARRREVVGANRFRNLLERSYGYLFRQACQTPFNGILLVCIILSLVLGETRPAAVMGLMVVLSTGLRFWQERRSQEAARALEKMVAVTAAVARPEVPGGPGQVAVEDLVPGDVVHLTPGDMVPADLRLLSAQGLEVSETTFTGDGSPVSKTARSLSLDEDSRIVEEAENLCFLGTHVVRGAGVGVVLSTGKRTRMGRSAARLFRPPPESEFQRGVQRVSWLLLTFMAALVPTVLLLNGILLGNWTEALLFALAVAVGLTPELLPVMVNVNLARAARALAGRGLIIKNLPAVHSLGSMDVLCLDENVLKGEVQEHVPLLLSLGVRAILLTGEDAASAQAIARAAGLPLATVLTGGELAGLSETEARRVLAEPKVLAGLLPADKARVVRLLRMNGFRVGFLGDKAGDANALREADVGIATENGSDLARAMAEVIMTGKDLAVLVEGVREGRIAFGNVLKYIKITASSNFGNAFSVVLASLVLPFLPMRAVQLLTQNLLYDFLQFCVPWDRVDREFRYRPRPWSADSIGRFMLIFGPLSSVFDLATFAFLWFVIGANTVADQAIFQTGWFLVGILTQVFIFFVLRTGGLPFWVERASPPVALAGIMVAGVALVLPWTPFGTWLGFVSLPPWYLLWVGFILLSYATSAQIAKMVYRRKWRSWW